MMKCSLFHIRSRCVPCMKHCQPPLHKTNLLMLLSGKSHCVFRDPYKIHKCNVSTI